MLFPIIKYSGILMLVAGMNACKGKSHATGTLLHFDIDNREVKYVNKDLEEISGIVSVDGKNRLAAINDEEGRIYLVDYSGTVATRPLGLWKKGDYEDITADGLNYYVLESKGKIYTVNRESGEVLGKPAEWEHKNDEFESLYLDTDGRRLIMLCKSCREYEKKSLIPAFAYDLEKQRFEREPRYLISVKSVRQLLKDKYVECKPSAAAIHPVLHKLFILCSVGKLLLVCRPDGKVEEAFRLDPEFFPQPEGIAFSDNGDLFISNEGKGGQGTIIRFPFVIP